MKAAGTATAVALDVFVCELDGINLIEASAGTGKTWNICGLYLRLLLERGLAVREILVVTFTNTAAGELRERIRTRLSETLSHLRGTAPAGGDPFVVTLLETLRGRGLADHTMSDTLEQALQAFDEASIFTIHGFCQRALADTPFTAGVPMSTELLTDDASLRDQVVHDFWRRRVAGDGLPSALAQYLIRSRETPARWSALLKRRLGKPLSKLIWADDNALPPLPDEVAIRRAYGQARALWQAQGEDITGWVLQSRDAFHAGTYKPESIQTAVTQWNQFFAGEDALAAPTDLGKLRLFTTTGLTPKKDFKTPVPHPFFAQAEALLAMLHAADEALERHRLELLRALLEEGPPALARAKQQRRVVSFDDMLLNLHTRLSNDDSPWLARALRARFPAALIDEFQDTDPLQFEIFTRIYDARGEPPQAGASAPTVFLVGDPKQAIYSFRSADLHTYLRARDVATREYSLAQNQRSSTLLIEGLNALFGANPLGFMLNGLSYQHTGIGEKQRAVFTDNTLPRAPLQAWRLPQHNGTPPTKPQAHQLASSACASEIARMLAAGRRGEILIGDRPLAGHDIAVLVRSHVRGSEMRRALAALGVDSVELSQASIFESPDAEELERILEAVLAPTNERALRAALSTAMMGIDAAGLVALADDEDGMLARMSAMASDRDTWLQRGIGAMLRQLMTREGVAARLLAGPDGERRLTNLLHLAECLQAAAQAHPAPETLLRWLQSQRNDADSNDAAQLRLESDRNLVQIITIHRSKGLEYPVVFCPYAWDGHPGPPDTVEGCEYHDPSGRPVIDFRAGSRDDKDIKAKIALERAAENVRLLYVALTRAVHRCVIVIGAYSSAGSTKEWPRAPVNWLAAGQGATPGGWLGDASAKTNVEAAWNTLAQRHPESIRIDPLPESRQASLAPDLPDPGALTALAAPQRLSAGWRLGSFSSLSQGSTHEGAARDHDLLAPAPDTAPIERTEGAPPDAQIDRDDILLFPRGTGAGDCLHAAFEQADFTDPTTWPGAIDQALAAHPQTGVTADLRRRLPAMISSLLRDVLSTELVPGLRLSGVPRARRLVEMEFTLPSNGLRTSSLAATMRAHGYAAPQLSAASLDGYLRGFIDLVFEHQGRYFVLDWKSNYLGNTPADYAPDRLNDAMTRSGYHLQALLYSVALHRFLGQRLAGYDPVRHLGGVLYLFVRGVRPTWRAGADVAAGVHFDRPSPRVIEQLSALFKGETA